MSKINPVLSLARLMHSELVSPSAAKPGTEEGNFTRVAALFNELAEIRPDMRIHLLEKIVACLEGLAASHSHDAIGMAFDIVNGYDVPTAHASRNDAVRLAAAEFLERQISNFVGALPPETATSHCWYPDAATKRVLIFGEESLRQSMALKDMTKPLAKRVIRVWHMMIDLNFRSDPHWTLRLLSATADAAKTQKPLAIYNPAAVRALGARAAQLHDEMKTVLEARPAPSTGEARKNAIARAMAEEPASKQYS